MKTLSKFAAACLLVCVAPQPAWSRGDPVAPAVVRKAPPKASTPKPAAGTAATQAGCGTAGGAACPARRSAQDFYTALAATGKSSDEALDRSLMTMMSRLMEAGRCGEAAALAARNGRAELSTRARQLCPAG
jgi:hypothetical protein